MVDFTALWSQYWWVFLILVSILGIWLWSQMDISTKQQLSKIFNKKVLFILGIFLLWFLWHRFGGYGQVSDANRWMPFIGALFLAGMNYVGVLKYKTSNQLQCINGFHGSYSTQPVEINGFLIFAIDSFYADMFGWDYAGRVCVLRKETCEFGSRGCISISSPAPCNTGIYELPDDVRSYIENDAFLKTGKKKVYYGWFDDVEHVDYTYDQLAKIEETKLKATSEGQIYALLKKELGVDNPKISTLWWLYKNQCKSISKQTEQYDATVESVEKGVEHQKRVKDAYQVKEQGFRSAEGHEEY